MPIPELLSLSPSTRQRLAGWTCMLSYAWAVAAPLAHAGRVLPLAGNRTSVTDGEDNTTVLTYDAQNRVLTEHFANVPGQDASIVTHIYNEVNELGRFSTVSEGMRFYYDVRGQLRQTHHQATVRKAASPLKAAVMMPPEGSCRHIGIAQRVPSWLPRL
jgi:YD repeat-containing protein